MRRPVSDTAVVFYLDGQMLISEHSGHVCGDLWPFQVVDGWALSRNV